MFASTGANWNGNHLFFALVVGAAVSSLAVYIAATYVQSRDDDRTQISVVDTKLAAFMVFGFFFFFGMVIFSYLNRDEFGTYWIGFAIFFGIAGIGSLWVGLDAWYRKIMWDETGLHFSRFLKQDRSALWSEIETLEYKAETTHWRVGFNDGSGLGIDTMMTAGERLVDEIVLRTGLPHPGGPNDVGIE